MAVSAPTAPPDAEQPAPREARWIRPVLAVVAAVGLLLLGAAGGLLLSGNPAASPPGVPALDSVDVGFAQDMTVHHQQAVTMAAWERDHTEDPVLHQLAADIEATQTAQIGRMQGWLELWGAPSLPTGPHMTWMTEATHEHGPMPAGGAATMPGMASDEELAALRAATGRELDVLFLQLMLRHHEGGAGMMRYAAERAEVPQVRNLAAQMLRSQSAESDTLRRLLAERGGQPLPL
ncbi:DUF305 domain-containing protein [Pseudonocardia sp.]|jgi:uncharacterized protein (DUF305 family)|uniref:DUF305 domain-containing protein n=1 Tax=Pseudonocardia sp. TaxID=60912 RepID=UPI0039C91573